MHQCRQNGVDPDQTAPSVWYGSILFAQTCVWKLRRILAAAFQWSNGPCHEIMALFVLRKLILQTRMHSHPVGLDVSVLVGHFVYFHTSCVRTAMALARLRGCAGSPEPSLVAYVISTIISWAGSNVKAFIKTFDFIPHVACIYVSWPPLSIGSRLSWLEGNISLPIPYSGKDWN